MTELRPLLETSEHEDERAWLRAARDERPDPQGLHDTALALGLSGATVQALAASALPSSGASSGLGASALSGAGGAGSGAVTAASSGASLGVLGKALVGSTLMSFAVLSTLDHARQTPARVSSVSSATSPATSRATMGSDATRRERRSELPVQELPSNAAEQERAAPRPTQPRSTNAGKEPTRPDLSPAPTSAAFAPEQPRPAASRPARNAASLARETERLDRARRALTTGDLPRARAELDAHAAMPTRILSLEAAQLEARLLLAQGDRAAAVALARRVIAAHPESVHVELLRQLATQP
jgi:hypothetical protein